MRRWGAAKRRFFHRTRNGLYDPYTYFHLVDTLLGLEPWKRFSSRQFADHLNKVRPEFIWDPVTVGRILNDLEESFRDANPGKDLQPIQRTKNWQGNFYEMTDYPAGRAAIYNLLDDLAVLGDQVAATEATGEFTKRWTSPLVDCPSLVMRVSH